MTVSDDAVAAAASDMSATVNNARSSSSSSDDAKRLVNGLKQVETGSDPLEAGAREQVGDHQIGEPVDGLDLPMDGMLDFLRGRVFHSFVGEKRFQTGFGGYFAIPE